MSAHFRIVMSSHARGEVFIDGKKLEGLIGLHFSAGLKGLFQHQHRRHRKGDMPRPEAGQQLWTLSAVLEPEGRQHFLS